MKRVANPQQLTKVVIEGYKSIADCTLELGAINVLIGANGSGKSNFIGLFRLVQAILDKNLQAFATKNGGPDALLHFGGKTTERLVIELRFGTNGYRFGLEATNENQMMFNPEQLYWEPTGYSLNLAGHLESRADIRKGSSKVFDYVMAAMNSWRVYHFHDTSNTAHIKKPGSINDNMFLRHDARNLAAFLLLLKTRFAEQYRMIVDCVRMVAPFFDDFLLRPNPQNADLIELEWIEAGKESSWKASILSDGTLRFICLATVFLQPRSLMPQTIVVDEPELGLHPAAISMLAGLIQSAATRRQVIVSTQSPDLVSEFDAEDIVVADRKDGRSILTRVDAERLRLWLEEYSLGDLWKKNVLGGRPSR